MIRYRWQIILRKLLFFFSVTGCCGGLYIAVTNRHAPDTPIAHSALQFAALLVLGIMIGILVKRSYKSNKNIFLQKDKDGIFDFFKQRIFLLFIIVAATSWFLNGITNVKTRIIFLIMSSVVFIVGLSGGIYDQFGTNAGRMLLAGMIPISGTVIFLLIDTPDTIRTIIWSLGFLYLLCSFLVMNNLQLNSNVFKSQDINIKSIRKIRSYNYILSAILTVICIGLIFFSRVLLLVKSALVWVFQRIYSMLVKFSEWITSDVWYRGIGDPYREAPRQWGESNVPFKVVSTLLVIAVIIVIAAIIILLFSIIKKKRGSYLKRNFICEDAEYIDESKIIKDRPNFIIKRKFMYTKNGLKNLNNTGEKVRYLYAFILERLYRKKVRLNASDTPAEIYNKILRYSYGRKFEEMGFSELTENYRKVRYGNKAITLELNLYNEATRYEQVIEKIIPDQITKVK